MDHCLHVHGPALVHPLQPRMDYVEQESSNAGVEQHIAGVVVGLVEEATKEVQANSKVP